MTTFLQVSDNSETLALDESLNNVTNPITLSGIDTTKFDPVLTGYVVTIWDDVNYEDPSDDPNMEKALVTAATIDVAGSFTLTRPFAKAHAGAPRMALLVVAQHIRDLANAVNAAEANIALKENTANKSTDVALGTSDILYPTQNAVKMYVDGLVGGIPLGDYLPLTAGATKPLTGPLYLNAATPTLVLQPNSGAIVRVQSAQSGYIEFVNANSGTFMLRTNNTGTVFYSGTNGIAPTHTATFPFGTTGIADYGTADQVTNYERNLKFWSGTTYFDTMERGGTGQWRAMRWGTFASSGTRYLQSNSTGGLGFIQVVANNLTSGESAFRINANGINSAGIAYGQRLTFTASQSLTAGYTAQFIDITESTTGSGPKNIVDWQVNAATRFKVENNGNTTIAGSLIMPGTTSGIIGSATTDITRIFGGNSITDGAGIVMGGSTNGSIPNAGQLRVGSIGIFEWVSNQFRPTSNNVYSLGNASQAFSDVYATNFRMSTIVSITSSNGNTMSLNGQRIGLGTGWPTNNTTGSADRSPDRLSTVQMNSRSFFDSIGAFSGMKDRLYMAHLNPDITVSSNYGDVARIFDGNYSDSVVVPIASLATTPWVISAEWATGIATDITNLVLVDHRISYDTYGTANKLIDYKIEVKNINNTWDTVVERTGANDPIGLSSFPLHIQGNTYPDGNTAYHNIRGVRITINNASSASWTSGVLIAGLKLIDSRPTFTPAEGLGALDIKGGWIYGNLDTTGYIKPQSIRLNQSTPTYTAGQLYWDAAEDELSFMNNDANVSLQIGAEQRVKVVNGTASTIANGVPVYITGQSGGTPTVALSGAGTMAKAGMLGLTTESIAAGATGYVTVSGKVRGFNTSGFTAGATLYLSATNGLMASTTPGSPNYVVRIGTVLVSDATNGVVMVAPQLSSLFQQQAAATDLGTVLSNFNYRVAGTTYTLTTSGTVTLTGQLIVAGVRTAVRTLTAAATLTTTDYTIFANTTAGGFTLTLPTAVGVNGRTYEIKKISNDGNTLTIATTSGQTIDGAASFATTATTRPSFTFKSDGANWWIV